ncbi:MAG: transposase [Planctomycetota bacterium]|jgi:putative transposase|nr:transposase [Planctomycetota bacterium]
MRRQRYDTDLTDGEWAIFEKTMREIRKSPMGRKPGIPRREVVNGILYRLRTGCQWRNLPHDFPSNHNNPFKNFYNLISVVNTISYDYGLFS